MIQDFAGAPIRPRRDCEVDYALLLRVQVNCHERSLF